MAPIPAMIACMLNGSLRFRLCSWNASSRKSNSATPVNVAMSRRRAAMDVWLRSTSSETMAGSVSIGAGAPPTVGPTGPPSGSVGTKSGRSRTISSASLISGSDLPIISRKPARLVGDASSRVASTNSLPPASCVDAMAVSCHMESPSGFMGSVIICW